MSCPAAHAPQCVPQHVLTEDVRCPGPAPPKLLFKKGCSHQPAGPHALTGARGPCGWRPRSWLSAPHVQARVCVRTRSIFGRTAARPLSQPRRAPWPAARAGEGLLPFPLFSAHSTSPGPATEASEAHLPPDMLGAAASQRGPAVSQDKHQHRPQGGRCPQTRPPLGPMTHCPLEPCTSTCPGRAPPRPLTPSCAAAVSPGHSHPSPVICHRGHSG